MSQDTGDLFNQTIIRKNCLLIGDCAVGKSCVVRRFVSDGSEFSKAYSMTCSVQLQQKSVRVPDSEVSVEIHILDVSGMNVYKYLLSADFDVSVVIVAYDVTNDVSFNSAADWLKSWSAAANHESKHLPGVLLACKTDLLARRKVSATAGAEMADQLSLTYMECSAMNNSNINEVFYFVANAIYKQTMAKM